MIAKDWRGLTTFSIFEGSKWWLPGIVINKEVFDFRVMGFAWIWIKGKGFGRRGVFSSPFNKIGKLKFYGCSRWSAVRLQNERLRVQFLHIPPR